MQDDAARIQSKKADISRKISEKTKQLHQYQGDLSREQERERKKVEDAEKRRHQEQLSRQKAITAELAQQKRLAEQLEVQSSATEDKQAAYDVFISHASEDKDDFVRPLAQELEKRGFRVWYDEFVLKIGDSLRTSIDKGLANSRYGVVVLSSSFFSKNWPQHELNGLVAKEMAGAKVVLPIWHKVSKNEVLANSPTLADKLALNSSLSSIEEIADELADVLTSE